MKNMRLWMPTLLSQRLDVSGERALDIFYTSRTNERLHDEHTGLYLMSDLYIVDEVIRELQGRCLRRWFVDGS